MADRILVTGADGHVGRLLTRHYLERGDQPLLLWTRATDPAAAVARMGGTVSQAHLTSGLVRLAGGDLRDPSAFASLDAEEVSAIVHLAAVTSFTVSAGEATAVNVQGTARVLELAARCPRLGSVCVASTVYAAGLTNGPVPERALPQPATFANEYERSKWEAETLAHAFDAHVPTSVVRLATVVADDDTGVSSARNAVHHTLDLLRHGLLSLMPGDPDTPVYLVAGDLAVEALVSAVAARARGVFHASPTAEESPTLDRALDIAFGVFGAAGPAGRPAPRPRFADLTSFTLLAEGAGSFGGGVLGQALHSLLPFARQLYSPKQVLNDRLRELLGGRRPQDPAALLAAACAALQEPGPRAPQRGRHDERHGPSLAEPCEDRRVPA